MTKNEIETREEAIAQKDKVCALVRAIMVDYDRMDELNGIRDEFIGYDIAFDALMDEYREETEAAEKDRIKAELDATQAEMNKLGWGDEMQAELEELEDDADGCTNLDDAERALLESALDVGVRSGWTNPAEKLEASEFMILLSTGGPSVRIVGELDAHGIPDRAWIEYCNWGITWRELCAITSEERELILAYCQHFFG